MSGSGRSVAAALPLRPSAFAVLAALAAGASAGFEIMERANAAFPAHPFLGPGTLYRTLRELHVAGQIRTVDAPRSAQPGDDRRQYYELTAFGRAVLEAEGERIRRLLSAAGLLGPRVATS